MFEHLRRLATTGAAYTAASVLSKLIALVLLPIYTAYLSPAEYGDVEIMIATLVAASIVVRLGVIEAILRFYYLAGERPEAVVRTGFASLFWTTTLLAAIAMPLAGPVSELLLDGRSEPGLMRKGVFALIPALIACCAMWAARRMSSYEELVQLPISATDILST